MSIRKSIAATIILLATTASAYKAAIIRSILSPDQMVIEGISYQRVLEIFRRMRYVEYGEPIAVEINLEEGFVDLSDFDGWTVRVPLAEAQSQPNKVDATK